MDPLSTETQETPAQPDQNDRKDLEKKTQRRPADWRTRIDACKTYRRKLIANWVTNIDYRRGKPFASQTDEDRVVVPLDWSMEKAKHASLFSQLPQVRVNHPPQTATAGPWLHAFEQRLNDTLVTAGIETAIDECLPDCINAAGIGVILVSHESLIEQVQVPTYDPSTFPPDEAQQIQQTKLMPDGSPIPMTTVPRVMDHRYVISRISPSDFLWPINFTGADFDNAPWVGRSGRVTWAQAQQLFNLTDEDHDTVMGENRTTLDRLTHDVDRDKTQADEVVGFDELFFKEYEFDTKARAYGSIHRLVFVNGKDEPVVDETWKGQRIDQASGSVLGAMRYPIRVLTLTYITDETIPPSDSAMSRSQVNEINKSRTQMILQRERSLPVRWFDVNRIDTTIQQSLMRGTWQGMIPVQGNGQNSIGEVARSNMPQEDFTFDQIAKSDLQEILGFGPNQQGGFGQGRQSASESNIVQSNFTTRIGRERAKVGKFLTSIAEVVGGLLALYEDQSSFGEGFDPAISKALNYSILTDSTILLDVEQRRERIKDFINFTAKSGWLNIEPALKEYATLSGFDPNSVIQAPQPKPPVEPTISLRLTGVEDVMNPITLAFLMKSGQAPPADLIEQAKRLIQQALMPPAQGPGAAPQGDPNAPPSGPGGPAQSGAPGSPGVQGLLGQPQGSGLAPVGPGNLPPPQAPPPPRPPKIGEAHPLWSSLDRINKRINEKD